MHPSWEAQQLYLKALALGARGRLTEAHKLYRKAIEYDPTRADFWNGEGFVFCMEGRYDQALACYDRALALDNSIADAWNGRGYALAALNKYDAAKDSFQHALRVKPNFAYAWSGLGMIWNVSGRYDEAFSACKHAAELDPSLAQAWFHMASALALSPMPIADASDRTAASCLCRAVHLQETFRQTFPLPPASLLSMATELDLPLLVLRIIEKEPSISPSQISSSTARTISQARLIASIIERITSIAGLEEADRELLCGIVNLLNGDPMRAHAHLEHADTLDENRAATQYFLVRSLANFCEPAEKEIAFALDVARKTRVCAPPRNTEQVYYSALILDFAAHAAEAQETLVSATDHLPSLYTVWHILCRLDNPLQHRMLSHILYLESQKGTFLKRGHDRVWRTASAPRLMIESANLPEAIRLAAHFFELSNILAAAAKAANSAAQDY